MKRMRAQPQTLLALLARGTQAVTMLAAALCIGWRLDAGQQGIFFTIMSFGALLQACDFGLSYSSLQMASQLRSTGAAARLPGLRILARRWIRAVLAIASLAIGGLGAATFSMRPDTGGVGPEWIGPWIAFLPCIYAAQLMNLELALHEGESSAVQAWKVRWWMELASGATLVLALLAGAGLWSLSMYWVIRAALPAIYLRSVVTVVNPQHACAVPHALDETGVQAIDWRAEVWPFQWRVGLSGLSGFLVFQALTPLVLLAQGPEVAGRFGMSLAIMNMMLAVSSVWPLSQVSVFVSLLATGKTMAARVAFRRMFAASGAFACVLGVGLYGFLSLVIDRHWPLSDRMLDAASIAMLLAAAMVHHAGQCFAVVLRAQQSEPLLVANVVVGVLTVCATWICASYGTVGDVVLANLGCAALGSAWAAACYLKGPIGGERAGSRGAP